LEAQRITGVLGRHFVGQVACNVSMVEAIVIEYGGAESERRDEAVDGGEPILALAQVGNHLEAPRGLAQADEQHAPAVAIDEIERSPPSPHVAGRRERRSVAVQTAGTNRAARLLEQGVQRMLGALAVEHVAGAQRELAGEPLRELLV